jgi:hypothetical protein
MKSSLFPRSLSQAGHIRLATAHADRQAGIFMPAATQRSEVSYFAIPSEICLAISSGPMPKGSTRANRPLGSIR